MGRRPYYYLLHQRPTSHGVPAPLDLDLLSQGHVLHVRVTFCMLHVSRVVT